jgi:thiosulfate dehydrogenase [quinone] large subunit
MTRSQRYSLLLLRLSLGWVFFYAGITKLVDPSWSAAGFLAGAKTFTPLYTWLASPGILPITNALNEWGLTLIGAALILGVAVRFSSFMGMLIMLLYYLVNLDFPYPNAHAYLVDEHVVYAVGLMLLAMFHAGRVWGLGHFLAWLPLFRRFRQTLTR